MATLRSPRITPETRARIIADRKGGMSYAVLCRKHGVSRQSIVEILVAAGLAQRRPKRHAGHPSRSFREPTRSPQVLEVCAHCKELRLIQGRSLCNTCYKQHARNYPLLAPEVLRRAPLPDHYGPAPLPAEPTDAWPGSEEKMAVMEERVAGGYSPFHPLDRRISLA